MTLVSYKTSYVNLNNMHAKIFASILKNCIGLHLFSIILIICLKQEF